MNTAVALACVSAAAFIAGAAHSQAAAQGFDPAHPPAAIGESLALLLERWGERAVFGADCGSWRGASVDLDVRWSGLSLRVMALLLGDRVVALRFEQAPQSADDFAQCEAHLTTFQSNWSAIGVTAGARSESVYDGPVIRAVRSAAKPGGAIGTFEADYRASRGECRVALVVTQP